MKKLFVFTLVLSLLLVGCKRAETPETTTGTVETVNIENDVIEMKQRPLVAVSVPETRQSKTAEDGTVIFNQFSQYIELTMTDLDVKEKVTLDFMNRIDQFNAHGEQIFESAIAEFNSTDGEVPTYFPYEYSIRYEPMRIDQGVLSFAGSEISYAGGIHPDYHCVSVNYDLITGEVLTLGSILTHEDALPSLKALLLVQLNNLKDDTSLFDNYKDTINGRLEGDESHDEDWYFTTTGLCFYFSPYEIGPYASGSIIAEIPYEELTGIIADEFFPAEQELANGTLFITPYESANLSPVTPTAELTLDPNGEKYIVQTDSGVQDIVVLYNRSKVFAMQQLTKDDAIRIQVDPEMAQEVTILYTSDNTTASKLLVE
jgi:hypothetical protein